MSEKNVYNVIDTDHSKKLLECVNLLKNDNLFCDSFLETDGERFPVHRIIMAGCSKYLEDAFKEARTKKPPQDILTEKIDKNTLRDVINYCYTGKINLTDNNVVNIQNAAALFQMKKLSEECTNYLSGEINKQAHSIERTITEINDFLAKEMIRVRNIAGKFMETYETSDFLKIDFNTLKQVLQNESLDVPFENNVFDAVQRWVQHDERRMEHLNDLIESIKIPLISKNKIISEFWPLCTKTCNDEVRKIIQYFMLPLNRLQVSNDSITPRNSEYKLYVVVTSKDDMQTEIQRYDPWYNEWSSYMNIDFSRTKYEAVMIEDNMIVTGGSTHGEFLKTVEVFNLEKGTVEKFCDLQTKRCNHAMVVLEIGSNKLFYVIGGRDKGGILNSVEYSTLSAATWTSAAPMNNKRYSFGAAVFNNKIFVAGGRNQDSNLNSVEVYDSINDKWEVKAPLLSKRNNCSLVIIRNELCVVGGFKGTSYERPVSDIEKYDLAKDSWTVIMSVPHQDGIITAEYFGDTLFTVGGNEINNRHRVDLYDFKKKTWKTCAPLNRVQNKMIVMKVPWNLLYKKSIKDN